MNIQPIQKNSVLETSYRNTVQAPNFAKAIAALYRHEPSIKTEPVPNEKPELSPAQVYEQMTGSEARKYYNVNGEKWCDADVARIMEGITREKIFTNKHINWESSGGEKLTQEQIDEIKNRYDVRNLDAQGCYDLLCDLTNMKVMSGQDVIDIVCPKGVIPPKGDAISIMNVDRFPQENLSLSGDLIGRFTQNVKYYKWYGPYLGSPEFAYFNPTLGSGYIRESQVLCKELADFNLKWANFFSQFD